MSEEYMKVNDVYATMEHRGASNGVMQGSMDIEKKLMVRNMGNKYFKLVDQDTLEPHKSGRMPFLGSHNVMLGMIAAAMAATHGAGKDRKPGDLLFAKMVTGDYRQNDDLDADIGVCLRYAETVGMETATHNNHFGVGVYRKPVDTQVLAEEFVPDAVVLTGEGFVRRQSGDPQLGAVVDELYEKIPEELRSVQP